MRLKAMIGPILFSIIVGGLLAKFMFMQYDTKDITLPTIKTSESATLSFLQVGVYSTIESMKKNCSNIEHYIYMEEDSKYHVYVALTGNENNLEKLKGYFEEQGYVTYKKTLVIHNIKFIEELEKYDNLLLKTEDMKAISVIITNVLNRYKELVIDRNEN